MPHTHSHSYISAWGGVQCLRVKSETLSKTFKRTQIPRGQDKTCISQVEYGQGAWQTDPASQESVGCLCVCEKYANVKYLPGVVAVAPQIKR